MKRMLIGWGILVLGIPCVIFIGLLTGQYAPAAFGVALLSCVPFYLRFESRKVRARELTLIAALTAISVGSRAAFALFPHFKPVAAIVILAALYLGGEAGFLIGSFSAVLSNFLFGQGPWTPFQMFGWGVIGLLAGALKKPLKKYWWGLLPLYGIFAGALYSAVMDSWTALFTGGGGFDLNRYLAVLLTSFPTTVVYMVSNVVFLLAFYIPMNRILSRMITKYGLYES